MRAEKFSGILSGLVLGAFVAAPADAATVIASTITNAGGGGTCTLNHTCAESYIVANQGGANQAINVPPTASFGFTDSFNQGSFVSTGSNFGMTAYYGSAQTMAGAPWNFQDNILFSTNGALVQAQASAVLNNVSDLQVRIISANNPASNTPWDVTSAANAAALLSGSGVVTVQNGWTTNSIPSLIDYSATMANVVSPGNYILQIRGEAAPGVGSSYSGTITFTPVPLPAAAWLILSGLAGAGLAVRRRSAPASV